MKFDPKMLKTLLIVMLVILMAAAPISASAVAAWINSSSAKIYVINNGAVGSVPAGTTVDFVDYSGSWAKIMCRGYTGITQLKNITLKTGLTGYAKADVPLFKYASTSSKVYGTIPKGTVVKVVGINGGWYQVTNSSYSGIGYVPGSYISRSYVAPAQKAAAAPQRNYTTAEKCALLAYSKIGSKYSYGSEGPSKFDCSGLTYYVYRSAGVAVYRESAAQGNDSRFNTIKSRSSLKTGDLVCFNTGGGNVVDHVGVYFGDGNFIHASSNAGEVMVSNLNTGFYKDAFLWGKRIV